MSETPQLSIVIPAYNEEGNIALCIEELMSVLVDEHRLRTELIIVNDNSKDATEEQVIKCMRRWPGIRLVRRNPPGGFGRAIRTGLEFVTGDVVIIYMADRSDHPHDVIKYYEEINRGYDCVFGSRFIAGSTVRRYPKLKLWINRFVNNAICWLFWTRLNDLSNAFKAYRREVIQRCGPYKSCHFNITLEMSLSALVSGYSISQVPIDWEGRTWGSTNLKLREMGRRYLAVLMMIFFQRVLMSDDVRSERTGRAAFGEEIFDKSPLEVDSSK